jgi:hypothetical protein
VGSEWSAPAEAFFFVDSVPADASNLVISEFHYRPADASPSEIAAGINDRDRFEFIELMNSGTEELNLTDVRFTAGIGFDFSSSDLRTLAPGAHVLLVNDLFAFETRYGTAHSDQIAGEYSGNLSNDGELLTLIDAAGTNIRSFIYNDQPPWPEGADGDGFSLVLINPGQTPPPDHADPFNWRESISTGSPGGTDAITYADWKIANGVPTPETDLDIDGDGRANFLEYVEGTLPLVADFSAALQLTIESVDVAGAVDDYLVFRFERELSADDARIIPELSGDLSAWETGAGVLQFVGRERTGAIKETLIFRSATPVSAPGREFGRIRVESF